MNQRHPVVQSSLPHVVRGAWGEGEVRPEFFKRGERFFLKAFLQKQLGLGLEVSQGHDIHRKHVLIYGCFVVNGVLWVWGIEGGHGGTF